MNRLKLNFVVPHLCHLTVLIASLIVFQASHQSSAASRTIVLRKIPVLESEIIRKSLEFLRTKQINVTEYESLVVVEGDREYYVQLFAGSELLGTTPILPAWRVTLTKPDLTVISLRNCPDLCY